MSNLKNDKEIKLFDEDEIWKIPFSDDINNIKGLKKLKLKYKIWIVDNIKYAIFYKDNVKGYD